MYEGDVVLQVYARICNKSIVPNDGTFVSGLKACGPVVGLEKASKLTLKFTSSELPKLTLWCGAPWLKMWGVWEPVRCTGV